MFESTRQLTVRLLFGSIWSHPITKVRTFLYYVTQWYGMGPKSLSRRALQLRQIKKYGRIFYKKYLKKVLTNNNNCFNEQSTKILVKD